jgi:hypothetical protein
MQNEAHDISRCLNVISRSAVTYLSVTKKQKNEKKKAGTTVTPGSKLVRCPSNISKNKRAVTRSTYPASDRYMHTVRSMLFQVSLVTLRLTSTPVLAETRIDDL